MAARRSGMTNPTPEALTRWPSAPKGFSRGEAEAWAIVGEAAMHLGTVSAADLPLVWRAAQVRAKIDGYMKKNGEMSASALAAMIRLEIDLYKQLGMSPQARRQVTPAGSGKRKKTGFEEVE